MIAPTTLARYATIVFDCDGVIFDSNRIKSDAFHAVARRYGASAAEALVEHHRRNGGVSRDAKFEYLVRGILGREPGPSEVSELVASYAVAVRRALSECNVCEDLNRLRESTSHATWMVVSGGAQDELREIFAARGLSILFDGGIFGSPDSKDEIFKRLDQSGKLARPAIYLGDSRYDHQAAARAGIDFMFVSGWTEFVGWREYCRIHGIASVTEVANLLPR